MSIRTLFVAAAAALGFATSTQAAPLHETPEVRTVRVPIADLDLRRDAGTKVAMQRIRHAAKVVCGYEARPLSVQRYQQYTACIRSAVGDAVVTLSTEIAAQRAPAIPRHAILTAHR